MSEEEAKGGSPGHAEATRVLEAAAGVCAGQGPPTTGRMAEQTRVTIRRTWQGGGGGGQAWWWNGLKWQCNVRSGVWYIVPPIVKVSPKHGLK